VKQLGDGVLLRMPDSETAVRTVAELVASTTAGDLPSAHAGIAAGPVITRDGDVFGRTVNLASRIADRAAAGEVLVEEGVVVALPRGTARFEPVGRVELKGFPDPIALWRATPAGRSEVVAARR
jgi:class 3 adenylate cyclase